MTKSAKNEAVSNEAASGSSPSPKEAFVLAQPDSLPVKDLIVKAKEAGLEISESYVYKIRRAASKSKGVAAPKGKPGRKPGSKNKPKAEKVEKAAAKPAKATKAAAKPAKAEKAAPAPKAEKPAKATKTAAAKPVKAAKAAAKPAKGGKVTAKDFVLGLPLDMPAADVVAKGAEVGLSLRTGYVHEIRSAARRSSGKPATGARRGRPPKAAAAAAAPAAPKAAAAAASAGVAAATGAGDEAAFRRLVVLLGAARSEELLSDVRSRLEALYAGN